jgi:hypothetical protein
LEQLLAFDDRRDAVEAGERGDARHEGLDEALARTRVAALGRGHEPALDVRSRRRGGEQVLDVALAGAAPGGLRAAEQRRELRVGGAAALGSPRQPAPLFLLGFLASYSHAVGDTSRGSGRISHGLQQVSVPSGGYHHQALRSCGSSRSRACRCQYAVRPETQDRPSHAVCG